ncbi:MAG: cell division protein FtsK [Streptosporangiaceae bacterium]
MSTDPVGGHPGAEVVPLRAVQVPDEVQLAGTQAPVYADTTADHAGERRPVIPARWQRASARATVRHHASLNWHRARFHGLRAPAYLVQAIVWAVVGVARLALAQIGWWWVAEQTWLRSEAIAAGDHRAWMTLHKHARETRHVRGLVLLGEVFALILAGDLITAYAPWAWLLIAAAGLPWLAAIGRPASRPIVQTAVVPANVEPLTQDAVILALASLQIALINQALARQPDAPEKVIEFRDPVMRDGPGWRAVADLPHGVTAAEVMDRRDKLASGLRRQIGCVWPENNRKRHPGALVLWVGDEDMSKADQPAWPLARRGAADLFAPVAFATDQRGRPITITLMFVSIIIGSIPRMGKTFLLRLLLLIAALDVRAELHAYDLKGTGDLAPLRQVAHRYRAGDEPEDIEYLVADFRALRTEMRRRTKVIRELAEEHPELCPENKVTPELAGRKDLGLHPVVVAVDECQVMFEHPQYGDELETIATDLGKRGPALGILQALATQRPDAKSIPTGISANAVLRMCLKVMGQTENDMVLGTSAYKNGVRATMFDFEDKGIFYFSGEGSAPRIARGQKLDGPESKEIAARARIMRERAGRLTGYALGADLAQGDVRSFAADVLLIFGGARALWSETIAARLAGSIPGTYADITSAAVGSQLRALGVKVGTVRETGKSGRSGCYRADVETAAEPAHA